MYLKSLVLKGFKSFADRCVVSLEPGITSVVGPNGSGKSNIADAVLWVLGERNAKNLRGQAMEDVIFSGSSARKSLGMVEVDLVLDNSDGTLPIDYNEVSLTRRMYRSGESEYLINGAPARRMDFMDILHDTGLGTGTHSIISQGNLDHILASKPEDRRALIEEAAGVLKHKQRKDRSARKLAAMDEHLRRVKDVFAEMERQLKPLARKAQRAQSYQHIADELAQLDLILAVDDLRTLQGQWEATAASEKEAAASIDLEKFRVKEAEDRLNKLQVLLQEKGLYVGDLTSQRGRFHMITERLDSTIRLLAEKSHSIDTRLEQAQNTAWGSARRISSLTDECTQLKEQLDTQIASRDALLIESEELSAQVSAVSSEREDCDKKLADIRATLRTREHEMDKAQAERSKLQDALAGQTSTKKLLESKKLDAEAELAQTRENLEAHCRGLDEEAKKLEGVREQVRLAAEGLTAAEDALSRARTAQDDALKEKQRIEGQITALEELSRRMRADNDASSWLAENASELDTAARPLSELIKAPQELEGIVERLLGEDLMSFCAQDLQSAGRMAQGLLDSGARGSASLLMSKKDLSRSSVPVSNRLLDKLEYPKELSGTLEILLGDVILASDLSEALSYSQDDFAQVRIACSDGTVVWPGAKISLFTGSSADNSVLARERSLTDLREQAKVAALALEQAQSEVARCNGELEKKRAASLELSHVHAQRKGASESAQAERERLAKRVGALEATISQIVNEMAQSEAELARVEPRIKELTEAIEAARTARAELEASIHELTTKRTAAYEKEQSISAHLSEVKLSYTTAKERAFSLTRELREREHDLNRAKKSKESAEHTVSVLSVAQARVRPLHDLLVDLKTSAQAWVDDLASKAALEQSNSASLTTSINEAREGVSGAKERLESAQNALSEVRVLKGKLEVQVESAISTIVDQCGVPLETALETAAPEDRAQVENEAFKLRRRLSSMGTIDSSAAEEYEAAKERYDYMESQIEDMEAARRALKRIVAAIDERMRSQFDTTFKQINSNFQEIFSTLFPGGSASLSLIGEGDSDATGVEINAQPRGKKISKMSLMSGGERSLTALALLFAVYRIRRTPFYILDEVEAALDDSNLRRLMAYLQTLRHETQLIMITHQRRTMEISDVLYGVSMQADGVTKVVSQRLESALPRS